MGLRFERSNGNSFAVGRGQRHRGAGGEGKRGCSHWGVEAHRGKELNRCALLHTWARFSLSPPCLRLRVVMQPQPVPSAMLDGRGDLRGSHHPKATPDSMDDPQEGLSVVC